MSQQSTPKNVTSDAQRVTLGNPNNSALSKVPFVIAIDGPAASGKGTIGRKISEHFGLSFLDTGSLYREVAHRIILLNVGLDEEQKIERIATKVRPGLIDSSAIRTSTVSNLAPMIAALPGVRRALLGIQREFARAGRGAVLDGRDIGTVVCPDADVKFFVTARPEIRAKRRQDELSRQGETASFEEVLKDILLRDERDSKRPNSPLLPAPDAITIDTSDLDVDAAVAKCIEIVEISCPRGG